MTSALLIGLFQGKGARWDGESRSEAFLRLPEKILTRLVLLGTFKDDGLEDGLALALFSKKRFVPPRISAGS